MNKSTQEFAEWLAFIFSFISMAIGLITVFVLVGLEIYIRWTINQTFTLLGGNELAALIISVFALTLGLAYIYRPTK